MSTPAAPPPITVLYFAAAATATGRSSDVVSLSASDQRTTCTLQDLVDLLVARYPDTNLSSVFAASQWSVEAEMVNLPPSQVVLNGGEEVAVIPPVSGG